VATLTSRNGDETLYSLEQNNHYPDCDISWFFLTPTIESRMLPKTSHATQYLCRSIIPLSIHHWRPRNM